MIMILGIETTTETRSVAVVSDEKVLCEYCLNNDCYRVEFIEMVKKVLEDASVPLNRIDAIAVSIGPGSYTGIRLGLSTAKGLALPGDTPLIGIPTLDGLSWNLHFSDKLICTLIALKGKEVYSAAYRFTGGKQLKQGDDWIGNIEKLLPEIKKPTVFLGSGALKYKETIAKELGETASFAPFSISLPRASGIAALGLLKLRQGKITHPDELNPIYARRCKYRTYHNQGL